MNAPSTPCPPQDLLCDVLVIGAGAGGLATAVTAATLGLDVVVIEKDAVYGGTTAWSGGWMWIPRNPLAQRAGIHEDPSAPRAYLRQEIGEHYSEAHIEAFLAQGPAMVEFFERYTAVQFIDGNAVPDFHGRTPHAALGGRSVSVQPFDARELGVEFARLRPPLDLTTLWGMGIASGAELRHFLRALCSFPSFAYVARRVLRHGLDLLLHGRGMRLVNGNALAARLAKSAFDAGVRILTSHPARRLIAQDGRIAGAVAATPSGDITIRARRAVVLACGGFPHDVARKQALFSHAPTGREHWSAAVPSNTGDGLRLGEAVGARLETRTASHGAWAPVSLVPRTDGSTTAYPHLIERAKPGVIAVTPRGQRFVNEADSYYDFMDALLKTVAPGQPVHAWLVCDHPFIRRYGLGAAKPAPLPLGSLVRSGYLRRADSIAALARQCGIDAAALEATVAQYNQHARAGRDPLFAKGETAYNRVQGDAQHQPNPCMAPIEHGPFYAVKIVPGSLGTFTGLRTDASARVLDAQGQPIAGLYACGNDMHSVMGGRYPSGGITLGPAMTFGYIAGHHIAGVPRQSQPPAYPEAA
ncbi:MAG: 3-oxosteroid 1-dehydrogenase [Paracidovorax wautersii]|uniref:3-oxosteroid 1-dehydrogenase n=1 Tax=Paracidovorax wautersii TaxID=1177982 RepID=A0A7V8JRD0_9BURK|nr:MAG: 3-oxosteroid 1-dehydrogenase [Paracidovorax wautersii]